MFEADYLNKMDSEEKYEHMLALLEAYIGSETDQTAQLSNAAAIVKALVDRTNWAGFYLLKQGELVLGPFQGLPACNRIKLSNGVCGTAARTGKTQIVPNVHEFAGHIACDSASNSELVIPIIRDGVVYGVLDIDSAEFNRFSERDAKGLERFVEMLNQFVDW